MPRTAKKNKKYPPKRAYTPPNIIASMLFVISSLYILIVMGGSWTLETIMLVYCSFWLVPLCLFTSYYFGLAIAKINKKQILKSSKYVYLKTFGIQLFIITISILFIYIINNGHPIISFDYYAEKDFLTILIITFLLSTIGFTPAYYAIFRYSKWTKTIFINKKQAKKDFPEAIFS